MGITPIRPSQFINRDGPGAMIPTAGGSIIVPSIDRIVKFLESGKTKGSNFMEPDASGKTGLHKFEIKDNRMERLLWHFNSKDKKFELPNIKIFKLPTNDDLTVSTTEKIIEGDIFPHWGICSAHRGHNILMKFSREEYDPILRCPMCIKQNIPFNRGVPVRFVQVCTHGHMQDLYWPGLVHSGSGCTEEIFEWQELSAGDNFSIKCIKCNQSIEYLGGNGLKSRSLYGRLSCSGWLPEITPRYFNAESYPCKEVRINEKGDMGSAARLLLKNATSIRRPKLFTSVQIPKFSGSLYNSLNEIRMTISTFVDTKPDWQKADMLSLLERVQEKQQIPNDTLYEIQNCRDHELKKATENVMKEMQRDANRAGKKDISEADANDEELQSLLEAAREGYPPSKDATERRAFVNVSDIITVESKEFGVIFRITPVRNLMVTKVQVGYSREVGTMEENDLPEASGRIGNLVTLSSYNEDENTRWYMGDQMIGEGIFIDIVDSTDPTQARGGMDPLKSCGQFSDLDIWSSINHKHMEIKEEDTDAHSENVTHTNPRFVWWHTMCHRLLLDLSVDSGFHPASLGERVYCSENKSDGSYQSGILIYTAATGGDGTLGGLVGLAEEDFISDIFRKAAQQMLSCSNDPICYDRGITEKKVTGACCHACQLISETTCSYQNKFLDRNLVGGTLKNAY